MIVVYRARIVGDGLKNLESVLRGDHKLGIFKTTISNSNLKGVDIS